jgi:YidC/Oxa1 family membrane protein insertase
MEKNTILAVVLCSIVLIGFSVYNGMRQQKAVAAAGEQVVTVETPSVPPAVPQTPVMQQEGQPVPQTTAEPSSPPPAQISPIVDPGPETLEYVTISTNLYTAVLSNAGGNMISWKLHFEKKDDVEMILSGDSDAQAFALAIGGLDARPETGLFYVRKLSEYSVEFYRDFPAPGMYDAKYQLIKRFDFKPDEYMFELTVTFDGGFSTPGLNIGGNAYTLSFGPQIGPSFVKLDNIYDYRRYVTYTNGKRKEVKPNNIIETRPAWAAITGKYFTFLAIPYLTQYSITFSESPEQGLVSASRFNIIRPAITAPRVTDTYRFYLGPKSQDILSVYNTGRNGYNLSGTNLMEISKVGSFMSIPPLEKLLKWLLLNIYKAVPNYGIAIILLTLFVKICFFPLTKKGSEATIRMQALAPKIKELQEKYKDNRQKLNTEMAQFYQREGYNPISGCLPMLLQLPIFFAMYSLFNNHFDLLNAEFIPGWIPDLSKPEAIVNFPDGFRLPILGWTALRALPFLYVGSQLIYGKVTQMPGQQSNTQMKMMLYIMPLVFFFILYNVPSGLLVYWICSNLLTLVQQLIINKFIIKKKALAAQQEQAQQPVIAPGGKKKKNKIKK